MIIYLTNPIFNLILILSFSNLFISLSSRSLTSTTVTGELTEDGHIYTLINNYGIWVSIIIYGIFWFLIFLSLLIPFDVNCKNYNNLPIQSMRANVELADAKFQNPNILFSPDLKAPKMTDQAGFINNPSQDDKTAFLKKIFKISPIYSILASRSYGECTRIISLFIVNVMTFIMFLAILYNSDRFNVYHFY